MNNVLELINLNFKQHHSIEFYANKLNLTAKSLSQKVVKKSSVSIKQLISEKLINEASQMIQNQVPVYAIANELGFQEPNHFTAFYKLNTGKTPTQFYLIKQNCPVFEVVFVASSLAY
jgi:AraC-like DNA-binding protein